VEWHSLQGEGFGVGVRGKSNGLAI
jgi:hypothetical protein